MSEEMILIHHGVKGQKWGVRNGPPYPIEHPVMRKGTKLRTVTGGYTSRQASTPIHKSHKRSWTYTYNPEDKWDSKVYKGPFSVYLVQGRGANYIAEHSLETVRDLRMPNKAQRLQEFKDLYNDKKFNKRVIREMSEVQHLLQERGVGSEKARTVDLGNLKSKEDYAAAYEVFNHAMEWSQYYKTTREYTKRISKKYDAMVDDNNQGIYNDVHDPVIIFRINDVMYEHGAMPVRLLAASEIMENYYDVAEELAKQGKSPML